MSSRPDVADGAFWGDVDDEVALERYRTLVETLDDGICQIDDAGRFVAVNEAVVELTGYARDELVGEHVSVVLDETDVETIKETISDQLSGGDADVAPIELGIRTAAGGTVPCEIRISPFVAGDEFEGAIGIVRDRSETVQRLETFESARPSTESITAVLDEANIGVMVLDESFDISWLDETVVEYLGLDREDVVGRDKRTVIEGTLTETFAEPTSFADAVQSTYEDDSYLERFECRVDGDASDELEDRWLEYQSKPIESGTYAGGRIELYYDVTDRKQSEGALRERNAEFDSLVDAVEEYAIFRLDRDGHVVSWNEGAKQTKGYDRTEILGKHFSTFYTEADRAANVPEQNLESATENGSVEDEGWRVRKDGTQFWANVTITPIWDDDDTHQGYLKVTRDMTDRRQYEQELETELQHIFSRVSDAFYAVDNEFRFTHVNDRAEDLLQRDEDELLGENLWDVFPSAAEIDEVWNAFHTAREDQETTSYELYYDTLGFWVEARLYPSETGISVYFRDISDRKAREQELEKSEQRYRTIAESFPNGLVTLFDHNLEYTLAAGRGFDRISEEPADIEGERFYDVWSAETRETLEPVLRAALDGDDRSVELWHDGREWMLYAVPVTDNQGTVFAGVTMAYDITERKENQRKLEETIAQLEESNRRLEQFAYAASHDLQEPLRMVSSYLQLIENRYADELDEEGEEFLEFAVDGAERMRRMIDGLLAYSRVETRGDPLEPVELDSILGDVLEDLQLQIEETNAEITAAELPPVEGDANQLRQVFQNLLSNAIDYSGDDRPRVHIDADRRERGQQRQWVISVHDEGVGIDPDNQGRVFEVFERLHDRTDHPGTGIGLALCQRIVERHGGELWVESTPGEGSTFSFALPAA